MARLQPNELPRVTPRRRTEHAHKIRNPDAKPFTAGYVRSETLAAVGDLRTLYGRCDEASKPLCTAIANRLKALIARIDESFMVQG